MGLRDKKRNQRRVLSRHSAGPKTGDGKGFLLRSSFEANRGAREHGHRPVQFICCILHKIIVELATEHDYYGFTLQINIHQVFS
jgi:hypothetical protein